MRLLSCFLVLAVSTTHLCDAGPLHAQCRADWQVLGLLSVHSYHNISCVKGLPLFLLKDTSQFFPCFRVLLITNNLQNRPFTLFSQIIIYKYYNSMLSIILHVQTKIVCLLPWSNVSLPFSLLSPFISLHVVVSKFSLL